VSSLLPRFSTLEQYRPLFRDEAVWLPALRTICARHGLDPLTLRIAPPGSNIVFWVEDKLLIKLFVPLWPEDARKETDVLKALAGRIPFEIPQIRAEGDLEGWPYLVLTRICGQPLDEIWEDLDPTAREQVAASLGSRIAALQELPTSALQGVLPEWPGSWQVQASACLARQRELGVSTAWLDQLAGFLDSALPTLQTPYQPVFLHADLNPEHLFCQETPCGWQVSGMIDFADGMLGHPFYEWVRPGYTLHFQPDLLRAMLLGAGFGPRQLDGTLSRRLFTFTLLHRFFSLPEILDLISPNPPQNLLVMQDALWRF